MSEDARGRPAPSGSPDLEVEWQDRILRRLMQVGTPLAAVVLVFALSRRPLSEASSVWWVLLGSEVLYGYLAISRRRLNRLRAWVVIATLYVIAEWALARFGFVMGPGVLFALLVVVCRLFIGSRAGGGALALTTLSILGTGLALTAGLLPPPDELNTRLLDLDNWIRMLLVYVALGGMLLASVEVVLRRQGKIIAEKSAALARVEEEHQGRERAEEALQQARKMEAVGTLAGGIAHDFNNILAAVMGYAELARADARGQPGVEESLDEIVRATIRARELVDQILAIARQREGERRVVRLQEVVREAARLLKAAFPATIRMHVAIDEDCGPVLCDPTELHRVVMNLCTNAQQAMADTGGRIELSLAQREVADGAELPPGSYVVLSVDDDGPGMDAETQRRVFDPYFTTKHGRDGTGLGLSLVHNIVRAHGGVVRLDSKPGRGSRLSVLLPVHVGARVDEVGPQAPAAPPHATERVLFVDDEAMLARLGKIGLGREGYQVTSHTSAEEALQQLRSAPDAFDLVVTDVTMPGMSGLQLAREILELRADLPIIACTGYGDAVEHTDLQAAGIRLLVAKPVGMKDLAQQIRSVLDADQAQPARKDDVPDALP